MKSNDQLKAFLGETLTTIDKHFADKGRPVHERPFAAAQIIVDHFIVSIEGDTKEGYLTKPWFGGIYKPIRDWYRLRYGETLITPKGASICDIVSYFGSSLLFRLPLVLHEPGANNTTWLRFPREVLSTEDPLSWLEDILPLGKMPQKRRERLKISIGRTAAILRQINTDLNTADLSEPIQRASVRTVLSHLEKAAIDETSGDENTRMLAVWELQMACEKSAKAYLRQMGIAFPATHDLRELHRLAGATRQFANAKQSSAVLPSAAKVISWRYAEIPAPSPADFQRMYAAALTLCSNYADALRKVQVFNNFSIQIKNPTWRIDP